MEEYLHIKFEFCTNQNIAVRMLMERQEHTALD